MMAYTLLYTMKLFVLIIGIVLVVLAIWQRLLQPFSGHTDLPLPSPTPARIGTAVTLADREYSVFYFPVRPSQSLMLLANFAEQKSSRDIYREQSCAALINGGFYTTSGTPLGLFAIGGFSYAREIQSNTFNGFFGKSGNRYTYERVPDADWMMQSGPVLFEYGIPKKLRINDDETARRSVVALNKSGSPIIISIIAKDQANSGPLLSDLPQIIAQLNAIKKLDIMWAMNLDGGTASAFISPEISLSELKPVGSYLCVR